MKLTKRQTEILFWVQQAHSNKAIAKRLGITDSTVKLHITALLKKYNARNRQQLAAFSSQGKTVDLLPVQLEQEPIAWIHRHQERVVGIIFTKKKPKDGWEPLYLKK